MTQLPTASLPVQQSQQQGKQHDQTPRPQSNSQDLLGFDRLQPSTIASDIDFDGPMLLSQSPPTTLESPLEDVSLTGSSLPDHDSILRADLDARATNAQYGASPSSHPSAYAVHASPGCGGLQVNTNLPTIQSSPHPPPTDTESPLRQSSSSSNLPHRKSSVRATIYSAAGSLSPGSAFSSPQLAAMMDITPLPSPINPNREPWKLGLPARSRGSSTASMKDTSLTSVPIGFVSPASPPGRKSYSALRPAFVENQPSSTISTRAELENNQTGSRSVSEYVPISVTVPMLRNIAVSGTGPPAEVIAAQSSMHREENLARQRGTVPVTKPPTPPRSTVGEYTSSEDGEEPSSKRMRTEFYAAKSVSTGHVRKYKEIKLLGQGTFSKVFLAVRQIASGDDGIDYSRDSTNMDGVRIRSRRLVAVKVVQHGPAGGADAARIQVSLQREVEIMKSANHPSLVHLKAFGAESQRALLVLNYCPGGDLFDVASSKLEILVPSLVRRIFSELVSAVRYLHQKFIVHRDIKLENVLLNIPVQVHSDVSNWQTLDRAVVTLTDLGLSRRIPEPPESPLLTTRCGSEDYAAPELLMGQPYDGRQTDAWSLGVLLYALMEGRLPFDALPGARGDPAKLRARTPHRIARCEWAWYRLGDEDGNWDAEKGKGFEGARVCVDGLLKRTSRRKALEEIRDMPWVKDGIDVDGGLRRVEEEAM